MDAGVISRNSIPLKLLASVSFEMLTSTYFEMLPAGARVLSAKLSRTEPSQAMAVPALSGFVLRS